MSQGTVDPVGEMVSKAITNHLHHANRRYYNERDDFLLGNLHEDMCKLVRAAQKSVEVQLASAQQLKAEIAALVKEYSGTFDGMHSLSENEFLHKLQQLSAV